MITLYSLAGYEKMLQQNPGFANDSFVISMDERTEDIIKQHIAADNNPLTEQNSPKIAKPLFPQQTLKDDSLFGNENKRPQPGDPDKNKHEFAMTRTQFNHFAAQYMEQIHARDDSRKGDTTVLLSQSDAQDWLRLIAKLDKAGKDVKLVSYEPFLSQDTRHGGSHRDIIAGLLYSTGHDLYIARADKEPVQLTPELSPVATRFFTRTFEAYKFAYGFPDFASEDKSTAYNLRMDKYKEALAKLSVNQDEAQAPTPGNQNTQQYAG